MINKIKEMTENGHSTRQIEKVINLGRTTISKIIKENGFEKSKITMNTKQYEILIGTVIGDGSIFKSGKSFRFNLAHSLKQKEYFLYKYNELKNIIRSEPKERTWKDKRTKKFYSEIRFQSRTNELFNALYSEWYANNKKIINYDELMKCGSLTLAIKFFDDGYKNSNGNYEIAMHDYDINSIKYFCEWMELKFGIDTTIQREKIVYILAKSKPLMKKIINQIDLAELQYKI